MPPTTALTYSLTASAEDRFAIDPTTGVVTVAGAINRETDGASLNITVLATSADTSTASQTFTIAINDANEFAVTTPVDSDGTTNAVNENASNGTLVGITASASDADATTNGVTYSLTEQRGGKFAIDSNHWRGHGGGSHQPRDGRCEPEHHGLGHLSRHVHSQSDVYDRDQRCERVRGDDSGRQ